MPTPRLAAAVCGLVLLVAGPLAGSGPAAAADPAEGSGLSVTGFALGSLKNGTLDRDAGALDAVVVAGLGLRPSATEVSRPTADMQRVRRAAEDRGLRTELVVSNYSNRLGDFDPQALHRLLSDPAKADRVAAQVARIAVRHGWGGVNVDFERVRASDARGLTRFVRVVGETLPEAATVSIDLSAATSVTAYRQRGYHLGALGRLADRVVLMTYDLHGPTWSGPGPVGDLRWQRKAVAAAATKVAPTRLDLGVAGYGYTWPRAGTGRTVTPAGARRLVARDGVRARWHADSGEWSAVLDDGTRMWWSDARSYAARAALAQELGVGGLALWRLGSADPLTQG